MAAAAAIVFMWVERKERKKTDKGTTTKYYES